MVLFTIFSRNFDKNHSVTHALLDITTTEFKINATLHYFQWTCTKCLTKTLFHEILLHKLQYYVIKRSAHTLIKSYLPENNLYQ